MNKLISTYRNTSNNNKDCLSPVSVNLIYRVVIHTALGLILWEEAYHL